MQGLEFLSFVKTPGEKHIGIATIRLDRRFIFRFKIAPSAHANSLWITKAAYKAGIRPDGKDNYEEAFEFDSSFEKKHIDAFVEDHVNAVLNQNQPKPQETFPDFQNSNQAPSHYTPSPMQYPEAEMGLPF